MKPQWCMQLVETLGVRGLVVFEPSQTVSNEG
jgi:hypothetical protein